MKEAELHYILVSVAQKGMWENESNSFATKQKPNNN